ncbi:hypothetical protein SAMN05660772_02745 [Pasteurella testudinis DSM 23072]|uniref:Uncharacterized protein n=1 Tax=Pasteurella testudinis DSM 23072 TaxID=1122938 RepID=A0A1W1V435_9PAST|nr:hypothetical protein [Pasteurella testudinis]SMB87814.1 hypothetical protein SAMN05660772_02745 [Pasteurella testudinis DSM 23072]SUB51589.1 Uncharacterised protein [Pasteurella testudinis]
MSCNCIAIYEQKIKEDLINNGINIIGDVNIETCFPLKGWKVGRKRTSSGVSYKIYTNGRNGNIKEVNRKTKIIHQYCPFCGNKHED